MDAPAKVALTEVKNNTTAPTKKESESQKRENNDAKKQKDVNKPRFLKPSDFTPLTDTPENIFFATKGVVEYPKPPKLRLGKNVSHNGRFCRFHNQPGHDTNECRHLKNLIEELLKENKLQQYVKRNRNDPTSPTQGQQVPAHQSGSGERTTSHESERPIINVITGGPHPAGRSWVEMERYALALRYAPACSMPSQERVSD